MIEDELKSRIMLECAKIGCCGYCSRRFTEDRVLDNYAEETVNGSTEEPVVKKIKQEPCICCFGVLSENCVTDLAEKAVACLQERPYDDPVFTTALSLPVCSLIRDKSIYLHLKRTVPGFGDKVRFPYLLQVKEIWKQLVHGHVELGSGKKADNGYFAELIVNVEVLYRGDRREVEVIRRLRRDCRAEITRVLADEVLTAAADDRLTQVLTVPPAPPAAQPAYTVTCCRGAVYVAGRYNKYSRTLSQTPWYIKHTGGRRTESSIQEMITDPLLHYTGASGVRFSASGREDVDVRTLGRGRPFLAELSDPHVVSGLTPDTMLQLQASINHQHPSDIRVRDLQVVSREETANLKEGEEGKTKCYTALVESLDGVVCDEQLARLGQLRRLQLQQQTPVRVLHRRPMATRARTVLWMRPQRISDTVFKLSLETQAGTYIKEFVHGDFGRTEPSVGTLLGGRFDILALDVDSVQLDWPQQILEHAENKDLSQQGVTADLVKAGKMEVMEERIHSDNGDRHSLTVEMGRCRAVKSGQHLDLGDETR